MAGSRARFVLAQLGPKVGGRAALARCLDVADLPGGPWRRMDQRTWRTGAAAASNRWAAEAKAAGSITAWRSFVAAESGRYLWIQVIPLADTNDTTEALASTASVELHNLAANVNVTSSLDVAPPTVVGASAVSAREQRTVGSDGEGLVLTLRYAIDRFLVIVMASSLVEAWRWDEVAGIASTQADRLG